jgi:hypothetical protein
MPLLSMLPLFRGWYGFAKLAEEFRNACVMKLASQKCGC